MNKIDSKRVAWVTGAGRGIGRGVAKGLVAEGWVVAASARTRDDLISLAEECEPDSINIFPLDVTDDDATARTVLEIEDRLGEIALAFLNAGTYVPVSVDHFQVGIFRQMVETNLMGIVHGLAQVVPRFVLKGEGHIAVVSSIAGYRGLPNAAAYGATKAGIINMCEALRPELESRGVRLTLINPGFVKTPLTDQNTFPMPFLMPLERAVDAILAGLKSSNFEVAFPRRFSLLMKLVRLLPNRLFFLLTRRMIR